MLLLLLLFKHILCPCVVGWPQHTLQLCLHGGMSGFNSMFLLFGGPLYWLYRLG